MHACICTQIHENVRCGCRCIQYSISFAIFQDINLNLAWKATYVTDASFRRSGFILKFQRIEYQYHPQPGIWWQQEEKNPGSDMGVRIEPSSQMRVLGLETWRALSTMRCSEESLAVDHQGKRDTREPVASAPRHSLKPARPWHKCSFETPSMAPLYCQSEGTSKERFVSLSWDL